MTESEVNNDNLNEVIASVAEIAGYMWEKGWAEKNAGNISVNLKGILDISVSNIRKYPFHDLPDTLNNLAGDCFIVTATGKRMRDLAKYPLSNVLVIRINDTGDRYQVVMPEEDNGITGLRPTSELSSHLSIHSMIEARGSKHKVVMHTHANELVALTQSAEFCDEEKINHILWGMHPETKIFIPAGVGFVPYIIPGSKEIADATVEALGNHDVALWEKHGIFAIGETVEETFDIIDMLAKSASIFLACRAAGIEPQGLTYNQINELGKLKL
jgi:rhamnulose-1-phosphate aldolase